MQLILVNICCETICCEQTSWQRSKVTPVHTRRYVLHTTNHVRYELRDEVIENEIADVRIARALCTSIDDALSKNTESNAAS